MFGPSSRGDPIEKGSHNSHPPWAKCCWSPAQALAKKKVMPWGELLFLGEELTTTSIPVGVMRSTPFFFTKIWMGRCLIQSFGGSREALDRMSRMSCPLAFGHTCDELGLKSKDVKSYRWNNVGTLI